MEGWQKRLLDEHNQLVFRKEKLETYLCQHAYRLPDIHRGLLRIQLQAMNTYAECLLTRIGLWKLEEEAKKDEPPRQTPSADRT